jgi:hypothetical protein
VHLPAGRRELDRVVEEIGKNLSCAILISGERQRALDGRR